MNVLIPMRFSLLGLMLPISAPSRAQAEMQYSTSALRDEVLSLPGLASRPPFRHFSGYLHVDGATNGSVAIHYWFTASESNPSSDPLVYWTNGGPGCSGLIGLMAEQGPFRPGADLSISLNPHRWNRIANVLFVEQPCGVGFSYSKSPLDYYSSDEKSAHVNYNTIVKFLEKFPSLRQNDLIIASESYGGHYVPLLAKEIILLNNFPSTKINLKGMMVGNPFVNVESGYPSMIETLWGHQLLPQREYLQFKGNCSDEAAYMTEPCIHSAWKLYSFIGELNPYALDFGICPTSEYDKRYFNAQRVQLLQYIFNSAFQTYKPRLRGTLLDVTSLPYEVCEDNYVKDYLNSLDVKKALHVEDSIEWEACSKSLIYAKSDTIKSVVNTYSELVHNSTIDILIYSGDDDAICGTIGTQKWLQNLQLTPEEQYNWKAFYADGDVAGYLSRYQGTKLKFLTIHGAGHEVPTYTPATAFEMFSRFLSQNWI